MKITPAHDPNDYEVGLRQKLPMINILNFDGTLNENARKYKGLTMHKARQQVVADLERGPRGKDRGPRDRVGPQRPLEDAHRAAAGRPMVREDGPLAQTAMDAVTDGRVKIIPERYARAISTGGRETRLACESAVVVGAPNSHLVRRLLTAVSRPTREEAFEFSRDRPVVKWTASETRRELLTSEEQQAICVQK